VKEAILKRELKILWVVGFSIGAALEIGWYFYNKGKLGGRDPDFAYYFQNLTLIFWPSSIMMMATETATRLFTWGVVMVSLAINGFNYSRIDAVLLAVYRAVSSESNALTIHVLYLSISRKWFDCFQPIVLVARRRHTDLQATPRG